MINRNPETLNEIRIVRNVLSLSNYYNVSQEFLDKAYDFLKESKDHEIRSDVTGIHFYKGSAVIQSFRATLTSATIDGLILSATALTIIPHYVPHSYSSSSSSSSSGGSSGGGSSNNNNNNNNNNH